jgi:hypothetical protein
MDLNNKLKNMPHVYYFNLDNRTDRREYMETQFDYWEIDYTRISGTKFLASKNREWNHLILDLPKYKLLVPIAANAISHLNFLKNWLSSTNDEYLIIMEDDYDLNLIKYWHFDWDYLMSRLPYDWDCLQMGFENPFGTPFFLHPIAHAHDFGPCLLNRNFVEKLVNLHCVGDKYKLVNNISNVVWNSPNGGTCGSGTVDYFMVHSGRTYCLPLITINPDFGSFENNSILQKISRCDGDVMARNTCYYWWKNERDRFTLDDFFTYGKPYDRMMTLNQTKYLNYNDH